MYLKTVKLAGFKSFADRTRLEFRPGVSVVVGPNGSGKSNLVDGIHWVLGTQAPKALRTSKMEDVIFAGTITRPALNRAEVTVVLDNAKRDLPLDLEEVAITRRLYRDGSSDYEINGLACRLLDVQELLNDSGVGRHQHIIVNQGQIDSVLNASPEDHRAVIEEAAGILKHRLRKERASRRLERTDEDVLRLKDVFSEVARQMRPLKRQAEAAGRHQTVADEVRALTLYLGGESLRELDHRISETRSEQDELESANRDTAAESDTLATDLRRFTSEASELGEALDRDSSAGAKLETTLERLRRVAQVAHERRRTRLARLEGADERRRDLAMELSDLNKELSEAESAAAVAQSLAVQSEERFRQLEDSERSLADQENLSAEGALAVVQGNLRSVVTADDRDRKELESVSQRIGFVERQRSNETGHIVRLEEQVRRLEDEVAASRSAHQRLTEQVGKDEAARDAAEFEHTEKKLGAIAARARLDALLAAAAGLADQEARSLAEASPGALGAISVLLRTPLEWAAAVDAAVGSWSEGVAFADGAALESAVISLKSADRGGVPLVHRGGGGAIARDVAKAEGLAALIDLVGADQDLAAALFGDVVVANDWRSGWQIVHRYPGVRVVTSDGDLITATGIRLARSDGATPVMIHAAEAEVERTRIEAETSSIRQTDLSLRCDLSKQAERTDLERVQSTAAELMKAGEELGRANRMRSELDAELGRLEERKVSLNVAIGARAEQMERISETISALEGDEAERQRMIAESTALRRETAKAREQARAAWQRAAAEGSATAERRNLLETRRRVVEVEIRGDDAVPVSAESLERLASIESVARMAIDVLRGRIAVLRERQETNRRAAKALSERISDLRKRYEHDQKEIESIRSRLSALGIEAAEARVRRESVAEALRREIDASEEEALATPLPEVGATGGSGSPAESLRELLATRQAELRRMGPVNPLAAEEYRQLLERHDFMASQLSDLETSRAELRKVMSALDEEIEREFQSAFEEVATAYQGHFGILFPGGKGRMRLSDTDQPLTSGVEIEAQPLGKKVAKLSLLSGGERSLAALAFLFAVFKARPSPFYILDEVEAALDDSNLRRFLRLVEAFRGESQIVLITHQQQTMEAADVLYGVTMEPGGASQVIVRQHSKASVLGG